MSGSVDYNKIVAAVKAVVEEVPSDSCPSEHRKEHCFCTCSVIAIAVCCGCRGVKVISDYNTIHDLMFGR